jgi:hypothetical protein
MRPNGLSASPLVLGAILLSGCGSDPGGSGDFAAMAIVGGNDQNGRVGAELSDPLVVKVTDAGGAPQGGITVSFVVTSGGGTLFVEAVTTSSDGLARDFWTLGTSTGEPQQVEVRAVDPLTGEKRTYATFTATAVAGTQVEIQPGGPFLDKCGREGPNGTGDWECFSGEASPWSDSPGVSFPGVAIVPAPAVSVVDAYGNPVPGAAVTFAVLNDYGSIAGASQVAGSDGVATVGSWTAPTIATSDANPNAIVRATADGVPGLGVQFFTVVVPAVATHLTPLGDNRTGAVGEYLPSLADVHASGGISSLPVGSIVAMPRDEFGNATPLLRDPMGTPTLYTVDVIFTIGAGGGCVKDGGGQCVTTAANESGNLANITEETYRYGVGFNWQLGAAPGTNTVTATAPGLPPLMFTATGQ